MSFDIVKLIAYKKWPFVKNEYTTEKVEFSQRITLTQELSRFFGGDGYISGQLPGIVSVDGSPAARRVEVRSRETGVLHSTTWSSPIDGTYRIMSLDPQREFDVIARDHNRVYSDVIIPAVKPWPYDITIKGLKDFYRESIYVESEITGGVPPYTLTVISPIEGIDVSLNDRTLKIEGELPEREAQSLTFTLRGSDSEESVFSTIIGGDPYWDSTVSLLPMTGPADSTVFEDARSHNTWLVRGDAHISNIEPLLFEQNTASFNGVDAYLRNDTVATELAGLDTFTIEVWILKRGRGSERAYFMSFNTSTGGNTILLGDGNNTYGANNYSMDEIPLDGKWHHYALSVNRGTFRVFLDGNMLHEISHPIRINSTDRFSLGQEYDNNNPTNFLEGNLGYFRATKVARYTQNFIPPEAPFPGF